MELNNVLEDAAVIERLRCFFTGCGFKEVFVQHDHSILGACEDPETVLPFEVNGRCLPLPQTNQMNLEKLILSSGAHKYPGFFCVTTSYRGEPDPIPGRHERIFSMFEFEFFGEFNDLLKLECNLLTDLGFGRAEIRIADYAYATELYGVETLSHVHEEYLCRSGKNSEELAVLLTDFPEHTSPFWNMRRKGDIAKKIDVLLCGMETIGSAERSCDKEQMRECFLSISDGRYARKLFDLFGEEAVTRELDEFLSLPMVRRSGGGIGLSRLKRALKIRGLPLND